MACGNIAYWRYHNGIGNDCIVCTNLERMRCAVNREELRAILSKHFNMEVEDFVIVPAKPSPMGQCIRGVLTNPVKGGAMVPNIRALRSMCAELKHPINIPDARWAIENFDRYIEFVDVYNRLPESGFGFGDAKGLLK